MDRPTYQTRISRSHLNLKTAEENHRSRRYFTDQDFARAATIDAIQQGRQVKRWIYRPVKARWWK